MAKNDGGPAFPGQMPTGYDARSGNYNEGMTLRDYFAAAAMNGLLSSQSDEEELPPDQRTYFAAISKGAYIADDAMLAERAK